jgi:hypothetical protein
VAKPLAVVPDLDTELDALYALPPAEFTAARNDLARRLKQAGQDDPSDRVKSLRKPTVPLWAVNQLARRNAKGVAALLEASDRLRSAQEAALRGGESAALREATSAERGALKELTQQADELLREAGHTAPGDRVAATLRAAALTPEGQTLLRQGRLTEELQSSGFDAFAGMKIPAGGAKAKAKPKEPSPAQQRRREERRRKLRERAAKLREDAAAAAREVAKAEAALERARKDAERAEQAAGKAEAQLEALDEE